MLSYMEVGSSHKALVHIIQNHKISTVSFLDKSLQLFWRFLN